MNLYLKRFFLVCLMILSFNTILIPQSLSDKNDSTNTLISENEIVALEIGKNKGHFLTDSIQESSLEIREFKKNPNTEYFELKSQSGVFSIFNEIIFYWFYQL